MRGIHFIGGEKGGVGKSVVSRLLAQYFIDRQIPFTAFDSDRSHGALLRYYANYTQPIQADQHESLDKIVEAFPEEVEQNVLVDMAAQTHAQLHSWLEDSGVIELAPELDIALTYWHVMDAGSDSLQLLERLLAEKNAGLRLVVVLNEVRGDQFELLEKSGVRQQAQAVGAQFIRLHKLADRTMQRIDDRGDSFWAATRAPGNQSLGLLERQRTKVWLHRAYSELNKVLA